MPTLGQELDAIRPRKGSKLGQAASQQRFLTAYAECGMVLNAARAANIHKSLHHYWMKHDPTYPSRFETARKMAAQALEDEAVRRARHGVSRPVLYRGRHVHVGGQPLYETSYSDALLSQLLRANDPERFRDRVDINNLLEIDPNKLTPAQIDIIVDATLKRYMSADEAAEYRKQLEAAVQIEGTVIEEDQEPQL